MGRLTTNKPVDEMSMLELVYNSCCVGEDGSAMYKDFETVRDARDFVRKLYMVHLNEEMPTDDDIFDESMIDELQYEPEVHLNGLIALFYRNLWAMADLRETLKDYEDREEQGLLIELSCKVGTTIYIVHRYWNCVDIGNICGIAECDDVDCFCFKVYVDPDTYTVVAISDFGKEWFLTEAEAEEALAEQEEKRR